MKIAMIGYGKMGQLIAKIAESRKHIVVKIDPSAEGADFTSISKESLEGVDICIDFTHPSAVLDNIKKVSELKKNIVVGTTGWYEHLAEVEKTAKHSHIGLLYATNFSLGMNIFLRTVKDSARMINLFDQYDVAAYELHHNKKADSPSGTAKSIADTLLAEIKRKKKATYDIIDRPPLADELHFASVRVGHVPGTHTVVYDSAADTIELTHTARNREGFALGAVLAAEWLQKKKGFFTINDMMDDLFKA